MNKLYVVVNKYIGESYIRVYVWCEDVETALRMAHDAFKKEADERKYAKYDSDYYTDLEAKELFAADAAPFVTLPSDSGFDMGAE